MNDARLLYELQRRIERLETQIERGRRVNWTPTITQSGSVTITSSDCWYIIRDKICHLRAELVVTGSGSAGNNIVIGGIPTAAQPANLAANTASLGRAIVYDSGTAVYLGFVVPNSAASSFVMRDTNTRNIIGTSFALANNDRITITCNYEVE